MAVSIPSFQARTSSPPHPPRHLSTFVIFICQSGCNSTHRRFFLMLALFLNFVRFYETHIQSSTTFHIFTTIFYTSKAVAACSHRLPFILLSMVMRFFVNGASPARGENRMYSHLLTGDAATSLYYVKQSSAR